MSDSQACMIGVSQVRRFLLPIRMLCKMAGGTKMNNKNQFAAGSKHKHWLKIKILILPLVIFWTAACTPTIRPDQRIPLVPGETHQASKRTTEIRFDYSYTYTPGGGQGGSLEINGHFKPYSSLNSLSIRARFLDSDGNVKGSQVLYHTGSGHGRARGTIEKTVSVPPGTNTFAITVSAIARNFYNN